MNKQFKFFSGLRTSEAIGLSWEDVDFDRDYVLVQKGLVYNEMTDSTKTSKSRKVKLNTMSREALQRQKAHTFLSGRQLV